MAELEATLSETTIPIEEIIAGGGGEAKGTQRLRRALAQLNWRKFTFVIEKIINGDRRESVSHQIDHARAFGGKPNVTRVALEIEWNNKDPFYDRDLENFKRLHADGAISVGVIVTRGKSLHDDMRSMVHRFLEERQIREFSDLETWGYSPTAKQRAAVQQRVNRTRNPLTFRDALTDKFVADKFGEATTHWRKLADRVHRGVGNPCPLLLIGLPAIQSSRSMKGKQRSPRSRRPRKTKAHQKNSANTIAARGGVSALAYSFCSRANAATGAARHTFPASANRRGPTSTARRGRPARSCDG